jgi:CheY-like chemotaxis protein
MIEPGGRAPAPVKTCRVLLADDNPSIRLLATKILTHRGHTVAVACDGREAVERYRGECFDVVLMDVDMPTLDGLAATAEIRAIERDTRQRTRIVALSGNAFPSEHERWLQRGVDACLIKPFRAAQLCEAAEGAAPAAAPLSPRPDNH